MDDRVLGGNSLDIGVDPITEPHDRNHDAAGENAGLGVALSVREVPLQHSRGSPLPEVSFEHRRQREAPPRPPRTNAVRTFGISNATDRGAVRLPRHVDSTEEGPPDVVPTALGAPALSADTVPLGDMRSVSAIRSGIRARAEAAPTPIA